MKTEKGLIMRPSRTNGLMLAIVAAGILSAAYVASVTGGDINPTAPPAPTMRSLDEIYQAVSGQPSTGPMPSISQVTGAGAIHIAGDGAKAGRDRGQLHLQGSGWDQRGGGAEPRDRQSPRRGVGIADGQAAAQAADDHQVHRQGHAAAV